ncbi:MAG TPA: phospholipase D-like domain-containing protein, partial [Terriglobales bacterium]
EAAMNEAGIPINDQRITFQRSNTKIPHNKFIVRLKGGRDPIEVWTGSTNFTASGFLGQTNVGHRIADAETAQQYLNFWELLKTDPDLETARNELAELTPNPAEAINANSVVKMFSPRTKSEMLGWYGRRMLNAANSVWFTAAFGVSKDLVQPLAAKRNQMRFVLMEKPVPREQKRALTADFNRVILSYGVPLGEIYQIRNGRVTTRRSIQEFELDKWFFKEEHFRPKNDGFVFFVHTKFLLIDPLSDDPLVCSGSANFSSNSLLQNDENMLLIRGNTRVADIYMTEFDRIFRHFYFRDIANELAGSATSDQATSIFLDETDGWSESYFKPGTLKCNRRLMFFEMPTETWFTNAAATDEETVSKPTRKRSRVKKTPIRRTAKKRTRRRNQSE